MKKVEQLVTILDLSPLDKYILEKYFNDNFLIISTQQQLRLWMEKLTDQRAKDVVEPLRLADKFLAFLMDKKDGEKKFYVVEIDPTRPGNSWWGSSKLHSVSLKMDDNEVKEEITEIIPRIEWDGPSD